MALGWRRLRLKYPDCPVGRRIDLYLSRNTALPTSGASPSMNIVVLISGVAVCYVWPTAMAVAAHDGADVVTRCEAEDDNAYTSQDKNVALQISACMERARSQVRSTPPTLPPSSVGLSVRESAAGTFLCDIRWHLCVEAERHEAHDMPASCLAVLGRPPHPMPTPPSPSSCRCWKSRSK